MKSRMFLICLIVLIFSRLGAQEGEIFTHSFRVSEDYFSDTIIVNGTIDGVNSYTRQYGVHLWNTPSIRLFEPLKSIIIRNIGNTTVKAPRLVINGRGNWYDNSSIALESVSGALSVRDTVLSILYFIHNNRVSYMVPNIDAYFGSKLLPVYGYGSCDMSAYNSRLIASELGIDRQSIPMPHHTVSQLIFGDTDYLIDADFAAFYLGLDNSTISGYEDIINDRYLVRRTKHFGKNMSYDKSMDEFVSLIYYNDYRKYLKSSRTKSFGDNPVSSTTSYNFNLRPCESVILNYGKSAYWYQNWDGFETVPDEYPQFVIGNGVLKLETGFSDVDLNELLFSYNSIIIDKGRVISYDTIGKFSLLFDSPFPIHSGTIDVDLYFGSEDDTIRAEISFDGINWESVASFSGSGHSSRHIDISQYFQMTDYRQNVPFTYKYYLSFSIVEKNRSGVTGIDSLCVINNFQLSRFFMPALALGENIIEYSDLNGVKSRDLEIVINWQESSLNTPPTSVNQPLFPADNAMVDRLHFEFQWEESSDPDGDEIVDYEFFLSSDSTMHFPHSPNFNTYISAFNNKIKGSFITLEGGWLNSGKRYFWRVRARDSYGLWGPWSETWSFIPYGVMRPLNPICNVVGDSLSIEWEENTSGEPAKSFRVYGSQETGGFTPRPTDLIVETASNKTRIALADLKSISSFRITSVSSNGEESGPSVVVQIPSYLALSHLLIEPGGLFRSSLVYPKMYWPYYFHGYDTLVLNPTIMADLLPNWISLESDELQGEPGFAICRRAIFDTTMTDLSFSYFDKDSVLLTFSFRLKSSLINNKPELNISDSIAVTGENFTAYMVPTDDDHLYGDTVIYNVEYAPYWLSWRVKGDTLFLNGRAPDTGGLDSLVVMATDLLGESSTSSFKINIYKKSGEKLTLIPNNSTGSISVLISDEALFPARVFLVDMAGRVRRVKDLDSELVYGGEMLNFEFSDLERGIYILRVFCRRGGKQEVLSKSFYISGN